MALPVAIETISSLEEAGDALKNRDIDQVQFLLHEQTSLQAATEVMVRTCPGKLGYSVKLDEAYRRFEECMQQCDQELRPLEVHITQLKRLLLLPDNEIAHVGPDIMQRNQGVQHVLYPHPPGIKMLSLGSFKTGAVLLTGLFVYDIFWVFIPVMVGVAKYFDTPIKFPLYPSYEYHDSPEERIPYQPPYATAEERDDARSRDRRAQRAWWRTNLTLLETKKKILEGKRIELEIGLASEMRKALESQSDLGAAT
ncbi:hypothetical protein EJB05_31299, partial [Eragrostis curvula]